MTPIDFNGKTRVYEFCCSSGTLFALPKGELIDQGVLSNRRLGPSLESWLCPLRKRYSNAGHYMSRRHWPKFPSLSIPWQLETKQQASGGKGRNCASTYYRKMTCQGGKTPPSWKKQCKTLQCSSSWLSHSHCENENTGTYGRIVIKRLSVHCETAAPFNRQSSLLRIRDFH